MATLLKQVGNAGDPTTLGVNSANSNLTGTAFSVRCVAVADGDVDAIRLRCGPTGGGTKTAALYADNAGQISTATRLSGVITAGFVANTVITIVVTPVITVVNGSFYWLDFLSVGATWDYTDFATTGGTTRDTTGQTTNPNPHATSTANFTNMFNAWAEGTVGVTFTVEAFAANLESVGNRRMSVPAFRGPGTDWSGPIR